MRQSKSDSKYLFITGAIRALEAKRITPEIINQLLKSETSNEAVDFLKSTIYYDFSREHEDASDITELIRWRRNWLLRFIEKYSFHKDVNAALRLKYDYHNIKTLLKGNILETDNNEMVLDTGIIEQNDIIQIFKDEDYGKLPAIMQNGIDDAVEAYYADKNLILIDLVIDRTMFLDILDRCQNLGSLLLYQHLALNIDLINIQTMLRSEDLAAGKAITKRLFIPGGSIEISYLNQISKNPMDHLTELTSRYNLDRLSRSISEYPDNPFAIEKACDDTLTGHIRQARYYIWGVEPVYAFGYAVELELKILGTILSGIEAGIEKELLKKRLPEPY